MIQIRQGVFETNSSSTHSITMASGDMFDKWKSGEVYFNNGWWGSNAGELGDKNFLTKEEALLLVKGDGDYYYDNLQSLNEEWLNERLAEEYSIYTYYGFFNQHDYETYEKDYFTEGGERVVAFGFYGNN